MLQVPWMSSFCHNCINISFRDRLHSSSTLSMSWSNKLCAWRHDMHPPLSSSVGAPAPRAPPSRRNVAVVSHAQYVLTVTAAPASRFKAAVSKAAWWPEPLTFWSWKWCSRHVWRGLRISVPMLVFLGLSVLDLGLMYAIDRRQTDRRQSQTKASLNAGA